MKECLLEHYKFKSIYKFVNIISESVENDIGFWNFNGEEFVLSASRFRRNSLLHIYVSSTLYSHYLDVFYNEGDGIDGLVVERWVELMNEYDILLSDDNFDEEDDDGPKKWFDENRDAFIEYFYIISDEVVHILFNDKNFLVMFNRLVRKVLIDEDSLYEDFVIWPSGTRNEDGTIVRNPIPQWVKNAVYHRDKGHCVFCNRDLTGLVNILSQENFDHIIPLKDYGTNDPCNIQLTCEDCNKVKGGKDKVPEYKYQRWW